jgi:Resolvase, N terminal domain
MYLTRNQAYRKVPWVRIPPSPPEQMPRKGHFFAERSEVPADLASPRLCERLGYTIVQEYTDSGISGAKSHNDRPALDTLTKDTARRFDMVMCWSLDRLGRSILIHAPKS